MKLESGFLVMLWLKACVFVYEDRHLLPYPLWEAPRINSTRDVAPECVSDLYHFGPKVFPISGID